MINFMQQLLDEITADIRSGNPCPEVLHYFPEGSEPSAVLASLSEEDLRRIRGGLLTKLLMQTRHPDEAPASAELPSPILPASVNYLKLFSDNASREEWSDAQWELRGRFLDEVAEATGCSGCARGAILNKYARLASSL